MSGHDVGLALRHRFDEICRNEIRRLDKKLRGLSDADRQSVEAIMSDVVGAIARVPEAALAGDPSVETLHAVAALFALTGDVQAGEPA